MVRSRVLNISHPSYRDPELICVEGKFDSIDIDAMELCSKSQQQGPYKLISHCGNFQKNAVITNSTDRNVDTKFPEPIVLSAFLNTPDFWTLML